MHLHDNYLSLPQVIQKSYSSGISREQHDMIYLRTNWTTNLDHLAPDRTILDHKGPLGPHWTSCWSNVIINGEGEVRYFQEGSLGTYKHLGKWSEGRPVYEREGPKYFLFIREGLTGWTVKDSLNATVSRITAGRGTNFPGPDSGVSLRYGHKDWKWYNAHLQDWVEGGIDLTCVMR